MKSSATSFRNKASNVNIPGTKVSFSNAQLLTSTGSSTLDFFLGGGLAIGTVCAIEEDRYNSYAELLMKYFLAEGVIRNHSLFLASGDKDPKKFLKELPVAKGVELGSKTKSTSDVLSDSTERSKHYLNQDSQDIFPASSGDKLDGTELKIAWRYKTKCVEDTIRAESHNMSFDLTKTMQDEELKNCTISTWNPNSCSCDEKSASFLKMPYCDLYNNIKKEIESQGLKTSSKGIETILRIGINSIGSPLWKSGNNDIDDLHLVRFLYVLKALLRTSFAVAVITIPSSLFSNSVLMSRIRQTCDTVITLESFVGSDKMSNPLFKDFDGLLHVRKLPVLNTFMYPDLTEDLAFKLKKRGLIIERLHLPPELGDPTPEQREQFGCSSLGKKLDF